MARFIIANRLAGRTEKAPGVEAFKDVESSLRGFADVRAAPRPREPAARHRLYVEADPIELQERMKDWPGDVLAEPVVERRVLARPRAAPSGPAPEGDQPPSAGVGRKLGATLQGSDRPLVDAQATLILVDALGRGTQCALPGTSDRKGKIAFAYNPALWQPLLLIVEPRSTFWGLWQAAPVDGLTLSAPPLPKEGPLGWWHYAVGIGQDLTGRGSGIRIGVADSGVGPHPYLAHVKSLGAVAGGHYDPAPRAGEDVERHGTHVSGILAARPVEGSGDYRGIADGAEVVSVRVIDEQEIADQGDIAEAIDLLSRGHEADLINLSLGGAAPSMIELDAILAALEAGTLCIAAAGNDFGQPLLFPAAYPQVMSISALGLLGAYPAGTSAAGTVPARADMFGPNGLYLANFNDIGPQLDGTAPGVGIVSTVPTWAEVATPYAAMSGTSMASPVACASLATLLSQDPIYRSTPRDATRAGRAVAVMKASLFPLGLDPVLAGSGMSRAWPW